METRRTRSGRLPDVQKPAQGRSWSAPGEPRAARSRPKASLGQSREASGPPRSGVRARLEYRALSNMITERLLVVFALARESFDVCFVSVFTMFCWLRTNENTNERARRKTSKIDASGLQKSIPGASGRSKIGLQRPSSSCRAGKRANVRSTRVLVKEPR